MAHKLRGKRLLVPGLVDEDVDITSTGVLVYAQECQRSRLNISSPNILKLVIETSSDCTVVIASNIVTGLIEVINCDDITLDLRTAVPTVQIDGSSGVTLKIPSVEHIGTVVTCASSAVHIRYHNSDWGGLRAPRSSARLLRRSDPLSRETETEDTRRPTKKTSNKTANKTAFSKSKSKSKPKRSSNARKESRRTTGSGPFATTASSPRLEGEVEEGEEIFLYSIDPSAASVDGKVPLQFLTQFRDGDWFTVANVRAELIAPSSERKVWEEPPPTPPALLYDDVDMFSSMDTLSLSPDDTFSLSSLSAYPPESDEPPPASSSGIFGRLSSLGKGLVNAIAAPSVIPPSASSSTLNASPALHYSSPIANANSEPISFETKKNGEDGSDDDNFDSFPFYGGDAVAKNVSEPGDHYTVLAEPDNDEAAPSSAFSKVGDEKWEIEVGNAYQYTGAGFCPHQWTMFVRSSQRLPDGSILELGEVIESVTFTLHHTFSPSEVRRSRPPFQITRNGWGIFDVVVHIRFKHIEGCVLVESHELVFSHGGGYIRLLVDSITGEYCVAGRGNADDVGEGEGTEGRAELRRFLHEYGLLELKARLEGADVALADLLELPDSAAIKGLPLPRPLPLGKRRALWKAIESEEGRRASTIIFADLALEDLLGEGEFGRVYRGKWRGTTTVALKCLHAHLLEDPRARASFLKEARLLMTVPPHLNVVACLGVSFSSTESYIVTEYVEGGSLDHFLRDQAPMLSHSALLELAQGVAAGMQHLSQARIVHRDLAARNILVHISHPSSGSGAAPRFTAKVTDFGLARALSSTTEVYSLTAASSRKVPVKWTAPEAITKEQFSSKSDVWAFGVLLWEIFSYGMVPYPGLTNRQALGLVKAGGRLNAPPGCPSEVYEVMKQCWAPAPEDRPTFRTLYRLVEDVATARAVLASTDDSLPDAAADAEGDYYYFHVPPGISLEDLDGELD